MNTLKTTFGLLAVALAAVMTQAAAPTISCKTDGNDLIVTYTGTLYQSEDAVHWTEVSSASSPYQVTMGNKKLFFCAKGESENKNFTIPLSDTVDLDMIWIEPGTFIMGSPEDELGRYDDEVQHEVTLTRGYWLGKYAVTQAQYEVVMESNPSWYKGADLPVEQVTWDEAKEFCEKLTAIEKAAGRLPQGYEYSLPTEAQWEYACRAGTTTALNSGKNLTSATECPNVDEVAWYKYNSDNVTHPIGQKEPNAWGLYDMHGDIWEWCLDCYGDYPASSVTDPVVSSGDESIRIIRGGSWYYDAKYCRSAYRGSNYPSSADRDGGFRLALTVVSGKDITIPLSDTVNLDMIWIEPGTFMMGSPEDELGRSVYYSETQHQVTLTKGYWIGKFEVTQAQYEAVMGTNPSGFKGADLPVERVNWSESMEFCAKLTAIEREAGRLPEGYEYTLPTEAQWEYACRAGTTTALNNGKNLSDEKQCPEMDEVGWYTYNSKYNGNMKTYPAGQKLPNAWGLYDMHGNVWEWCLEWYGTYPAAAVIDPMGPDTGSNRVNRGGSIAREARECRSAIRNGPPDGRYIDAGFRVALAPIYVSKNITIPLSEDVNLRMIWIEPGTFLMGSPTNELGRQDNETQHQVTLSQGYWLGKYEITQAQYEAVMGTNPSWYKGANLPVECVSWYDAKEFCSKLTDLEMEAGRLPETGVNAAGPLRYSDSFINRRRSAACTSTYRSGTSARGM